MLSSSRMWNRDTCTMTGPLIFPPEVDPLELPDCCLDIDEDACRGSSSGYGTAPEKGEGIICVDELVAMVQPMTE